MAKAHIRRPRVAGLNVATFIQASRNVSAEQKAIWHNDEGAGRRQVIREFMGLNPDDEAAIVARIEAGIEQQLEKDHR